MRRLSLNTWYTSARTNPAVGALAVFFAALIIRLAYLGRILQGSLRTPPDTGSYIEACQVIFSDPTALIGIRKGITYLGFTAPFCSVRVLSGGSNVPWAFVQVFLSAVTAVLIYYICVRVVSVAGGIIAGFGFALLFEALRFVVFMLSETVFIAALVFSMWAIAFHRDERTKTSAVLVVVSFIWLITTRPFGLPIVAGWLFFDLFPDDSGYRIGLLPRSVSIAGVVGLPILVQALTDVFRKLNQASLSFREGWIYYRGHWDSPLSLYEYTPRVSDTAVEFFIVNIDHVLQIMLLRLFVFYLPLVPRLSRGAIVYTAFNAIVLIPLLVCTLLGLVRSLRQHSIVFSLFGTPIIVVTGVTMLMFVSSSWRYRAPLAPSFALITGYFLTTNPKLVKLREAIEQRMARWRNRL
ncbi:hypothetical protein ACOZ4I_02395 [Haloarcula salina]|uniref:hypothetical protein n=1 Tax=Haloarcula salina TaxID=1429914 RepID=UPI003C6F3965